MIVPDRLQAALQRRGISGAELARRAGISSSMVGKLTRGEARGSVHIYEIARELGTTPAYLSGDSDDPEDAGGMAEHRLAYRGPPVERADTVDLAEFNVAYGLGGSYIHDLPVEARQRTFSRSWIRQFTEADFADLFWATGNGTSMMPAILDSDLLLIDTSQRTPRMWDQYWAIDMHGMGMIKALRPGKDAAMRIMSINPDWPEELAYDGEMNVVGRVVAIVRKV